MSTGLHWGALGFYLAATAVFLVFIIGQKRPVHRMGQALLWIGWVLHTAALVSLWVQTAAFPATTLRTAADFFSWALVGASLFINIRLKILVLGALSAPLGILLMLAAAVIPAASGPPAPIVKSLWLIAHVSTTMIGFGLLAVTFIGAVLYLLLDWRIRAKRLGPLFKRLPSLTLVDTLNHRALLAGFTLMTIGIITGAAYAQVVFGRYWSWDPKEVWSGVTWLLYAALVHSRLVAGWRGRRGAWLAVLAFAVLMFTFIGAGLLMPGYHDFNALTGAGGVRP